MNEAQRLTGDASGRYTLHIFNTPCHVIVTNNGPSGINYKIDGPGRLRMFGWRIDGALEPFMPLIHAKGWETTYVLYATEVMR